MPQNGPLTPDQLRNQEDNSGMVGGGERQYDTRPGQGVHAGHEILDLNPEDVIRVQDQDQEDQNQQGGNGHRDPRDAYDKAKNLKDKYGKVGGKGGETGAPGEAGAGAGEGATGATGTTGAGAAGEGAAGTAGTGAAGAGEAGTSAAGTAGTTAAEAAAAGGAAGAGTAGGTGTAGTTAAVGVGLLAGAEVAADAAEAAAAAAAAAEAAGAAGAAGAGAAGAAGAGAAAGAAGAAAGGAATAGGVAAGTTVAATTGVETAGVGAAVGIAIVVGTVVAAFVIKNRKAIAQLLGILFVGSLLLITAFLNSLKPIASTLETADKYLGPIANIVGTRALPILARFGTGGSAVAVQMSKQNVAAQNTGGGNVLAATSDGVVTDGKLKSLYDAMKEDGFEDRIKRLYGLEFKAGPAGAIQITVDGKAIGNAHNATEAETILRTKFDKLQLLIDQEFNAWSWAQHTKVARTLRSTYGMALNIPGAIDAQTPEQLVNVVKYQVSTVLAPGLNNIKRGLQCFTTGTNCNDDNIPVKDTSSLAKKAFQDEPESSIATATKTAYDKNLDSIKPENDYDYNRLGDLAQTQASSQLSTKAVGILGWLDVTASLNAMSQVNEAQQILSLMRGRQSAVLSTWTLSAVNQMLASDSTSSASALVTRNFQNIEDSQAYNYVAYDDTSHGIPMPESQKVLSIMERPFAYVYNNLVIANPVLKGVLRIGFNIWLAVRVAAGPIITLAKNTPIGSFLNTAIGAGFSNLGVTTTVEKILGVSSDVLQPQCDPADNTHNWFNCFATGLHQSANDACKVFGCGKITLAQENELKYAHNQWQQNKLAAMPIQQRLFSRTVPNSFVNVAAMQSPLPMRSTTNVAAFVQGVFGAVWNAPQRVAFLSAQPAYAANSDSSDIDGIGHVGIPLSTLEATPLAGQLSATGSTATCPAQVKDEINMCMADSSVVDVLFARYTYNPAYGG